MSNFDLEHGKKIWDALINQESLLLRKILNEHSLNDSGDVFDAALFVSEKISTCTQEIREPIKKALWHEVYQTQRSRANTTAAANAATILNFAGISFAGCDLRGVCLSGANLSRCFAAGADFSGARLEGVIFDQADLTNVNFTDSHLKGAQFGQKINYLGGACRYEIGRAVTKVIAAEAFDVIASDTSVSYYCHQSKTLTILLNKSVADIQRMPGSDVIVAVDDRGVLHSFEKLNKLSEWSLPDMLLKPKCLVCMNSNHIIVGDEVGALYLYDVKRRCLLNHYTENNTATEVMAADTARSLCWVGFASGVVEQYQISDNKLHAVKEYEGHRAAVSAIAVSPYADGFVSGAHDRTLHYYKEGESEPIPLEGNLGLVTSLAFSPNENSFASASGDGTICLWGADRKLLSSIKDGSAEISNLQWLNKRLCFGTKEGDIYRLPTNSRKITGMVMPLAQPVSCATWIEDNKLALLSGKKAVLLDAKEGCKAKMPAQQLASAIGAAAKNQKVQDEGSGLAVINVIGPKQRYLASGSWDRTVKLWDMESDKILHTMRGHQSRVTAVAWYPSGELLASGGEDRAICLWDASSGTLVARFESLQGKVTALAWASNHQLACAFDFTIEVFSLRALSQYPQLLSKWHSGRYTFKAQGMRIDGVRELSESNVTKLHQLGALLPIARACEKGRVAQLKDEIYRGLSVNQALPTGDKPLFIALAHNHLELACLLIEAGADLTEDALKALDANTVELLKQSQLKRTQRLGNATKELKKNKIIELDLAGSWLNAKDLSHLVKSIRANTSLKRLFLGEQAIRVSPQDFAYLDERFFGLLAEAVALAKKGEWGSLKLGFRAQQWLWVGYGFTLMHIAACAGHSELISHLTRLDESLLIKDRLGRLPAVIADVSGHTALSKELKQAQDREGFQQLMKAQAGSERQAKNLGKEQLQLSAQIRALTQENAQFSVSYIRTLWVSITKLSQAMQHCAAIREPLGQIGPPTAFLKFEKQSASDKMRLKLQGGKITKSHSIFAALNERIKHWSKLIKQSKKYPELADYEQDIKVLIAAFERYVDIYCKAQPEHQEALQVLPTLMCGASIAPCLLSPQASNVIAPLLSTQRENQYGTSTVRQLNGIHFKEKPYAPGVEYMVDHLSHLIVGQGTAPTELLKVIDSQGMHRSYIASKTVVGKELQYVIDKHPNFIEKVDLENFSAMTILSLLTNPEDGKPDNYMVELSVDSQGELESLEIVGIDNDIAFADAIVKEHQGERKGVHFVNVKNVLYFFPQMQEPIDSHFKAQFLNHVPELVMIDWLIGLWQKNQDYQCLLNEGIFTLEEFMGGGKLGGKGLQLPIKLVPTTVKTLYQKLLLIKEQLRRHEKLTHEQLFKKVEPILQRYYAATLIEHKGDIWACIKALYNNAAPTIEEQVNLQSHMDRGDTSLMSAVALITAKARGYEDKRTQTIEQAAKELLLSIDYEAYSNEQSQKELYIAIKKMHFVTTPLLHLGVENNHLELIRFALNATNNPPPVNTQGQNALHIAASMGSPRLIEILLKAGINAMHQDSKAETPLDKITKRVRQLQALHESQGLSQAQQEQLKSLKQSEALLKEGPPKTQEEKSTLAYQAKHNNEPEFTKLKSSKLSKQGLSQ